LEKDQIEISLIIVNPQFKKCFYASKSSYINRY